MPVTLQCNVCGDDYEVTPSRADSSKYCSQDCYGESLSGRNEENYTTYECGHCGDEFEALKSRDRDYCSNDCLTASQRNRTTIECANCGEDFEVIKSQVDWRVCCSYECMGEQMSEEQTGEDHPNYVENVEVECDWCGNSLIRRASYTAKFDNAYCDHECYGRYMAEHRRGEKHPLWKPETKYGKGWNEEKRETVRERDGRVCQYCGDESDNGKLDVHHIQPADSFDDPEKRNATENLIALCRACHRRVEKFAPLLPQT